MKLTKCPNGHFYDADKHPECPYCNGGLEAGSAIAQPGTAAEVGLAAAPKGPVAGWLVVLERVSFWRLRRSLTVKIISLAKGVTSSLSALHSN